MSAPVVCVKPLSWYQSAPIAAIGTLAGGLAGASVGKKLKHPTVGAIIGASVGNGLAAPLIAHFPGSGKTAEEAKTLPPIDEHGFMTQDPDVCVTPFRAIETVGIGAGGTVMLGLLGALIGGTTGAIAGSVVAAALLAPSIAEFPFTERTASDAQSLPPLRWP